MVKTIYAFSGLRYCQKATIRSCVVIFLLALALSACQTSPPSPTSQAEEPAVGKPDFTRGNASGVATATNPQVQQWLKKAQTELALKKPERALDLLERALRIESRNAEIWLAMANAYVQLQQLERAQQMARKALALASGNESIRRRAKAIVDIIY